MRWTVKYIVLLVVLAILVPVIVKCTGEQVAKDTAFNNACSEKGGVKLRAEYQNGKTRGYSGWICVDPKLILETNP